MKKTIYLCVFLCMCFKTNAQDLTITTSDQNKKWLNDLSNKQNLTSKIGLISDRILSDTLVYYKSTLTPCVDRKEESKYKTTTNVRPLYVFVNEDETVPIGLNIEGTNALGLVQILTEKNIKDIKIAEVEKALAYGTVGYQGGVVFIEVQDAEILNLIKGF